MDGILLLNKPFSWTSHDAVDFLRRRTGQKKIGHTGTLDPMATGLLVMLLGKATRLSGELAGLDKDYQGSLRLGRVTDSWDLEGKILSESPTEYVTRGMLDDAVATMRGRQMMSPPAFCALKTGGKRYYELARRGVDLKPPAREMFLYEFQLRDFVNPEVFFFVSCSKGTYVRSLAYQVGQKIGCGACLSSLTRTRVGEWRLTDALTASQVEKLSLKEIQAHVISPSLRRTKWRTI